MPGDTSQAEAFLRKRIKLRDDVELGFSIIPGFPEYDYAYKLNSRGGPLVGGDCYVIDYRHRIVYKASPSVPADLVARQIKLGRYAPI